SVFAKRLETASGYEFQNILKSITSSVYINEKLLKSELGLLNTKVLKLLRSSNDKDVWKGCHTVAVICAYNPLYLLSYGGQSLTAIYAKL
ncbi:RIX1/PELP1 family protein, partial [Streptomyces afghaniensis]|uniref:RIX1/PELP1 family protein n=1 Tax=Streptomyces afghaniensis TaxID=66865 RepID=UPI0012B6ABE9